MRRGCEMCGELLATDECPTESHCTQCCECNLCELCAVVVWPGERVCGECDPSDWDDADEPELRPVADVPDPAGLLS